MRAALLLSTVVAALGSGLMAGLFFAFSTFMMRALARLPPGQGIAAMQSINTAIVQSLFLPVFLGTALVCLVVAGAAMWRGLDAGGVMTITGSALYLVGVLGVTIACNVPLNDGLAALDATGPAASGAWAEYVARWSPWNHVRTVSAFGALLAFVLALRA